MQGYKFSETADEGVNHKSETGLLCEKNSKLLLDCYLCMVKSYKSVADKILS